MRWIGMLLVSGLCWSCTNLGVELPGVGEVRMKSGVVNEEGAKGAYVDFCADAMNKEVCGGVHAGYTDKDKPTSNEGAAE